MLKSKVYFKHCMNVINQNVNIMANTPKNNSQCCTPLYKEGKTLKNIHR